MTGDLLMTTEFAILPEAIEACVKAAKPEKTDVVETVKLLRVDRPVTWRAPEE
jgi:stage III sporulation protein SpoIIIAA